MATHNSNEHPIKNTVKNKVQLITYPDSLGGTLSALHDVVTEHFSDVVTGGMHILPPFPSSGDRGFAPLTYLDIEPTFGSWEDIRRIGGRYDVMLDLMVNHISRQSPFFQDFLKNGRASEHADLFITMDKYWPSGEPSRDEVEKMFLRRTEPFSSYTIESTGAVEQVWTTFGKQDPSEQIDLDVRSPKARALLESFLTHFREQNVRFVRLDAIGYVAKRPGTSCFFVEPEIDEFLDWVSGVAKRLGLELLPEVHSHYSIQYKLAEHGFWIYDFILPYMVLEALLTHSSARLCDYLKSRPHRQFTMLDCHDGIPIIPDLNDLVPVRDVKKVVDICLERGANLSKIFSPKHRGEGGYDVHQIRCSYYSMLNADDEAYWSARALQFFTPGIPQVYYVGLLAGENDYESAEKFEGRAINRHNFSREEIRAAVDKPVVQRLMKLARFRNTYPAFQGVFSVEHSAPHEVRLKWEKDDRACTLHTDLSTGRSTVRYRDDAGEEVTL